MRLCAALCVATILVACAQAYTAIPRACSTPETDKFPFCDTKLTIDQRVWNLISLINDTEKPGLLTARTNAYSIPRLGLPEYDWGANCIHGVQSKCGTKCPTSFPNPNAIGATFNMSHAYAMGVVIGVELRALWLQNVTEASGQHHIGLDCWSPNININRDPRWGRNQEVPGEDPYLNGLFGMQYTKGLQEGKLDKRYLQAVVTLKHWDAYSLEDVPGTKIIRLNFNAVVSNYDFANTYFPAFKRAVVDGNAKGIMCSYNAVNGVPACASQFLNSTLRKNWKFDGYVTSDSGAVGIIQNQYHYVDTMEEAAAVAIKAGTDINSGGVYGSHLLTAKSQGLIKDADIDLALYRTLKLRFELGLFDPIEDQPYWHVSPDAVNTTASQELNTLMTRESIVLLKNNQKTLPFPKGKKVAVIGPHGNAQSTMVGNYIGQICPTGEGYNCVVSPFMAIKEFNKGGETNYTEGCSTTGPSTSGFEAAITLAKQSDYVVMILGLDESVEAEAHDRTNITLPGVQDQFSRDIIALKKPTAVVLLNGGAIAIEWLHDNADAIVEAFYPGVAGGNAIASVLFGDYNPGGKMPYTIYKADYIKEVNYTSMDMAKAPGRTYRYYTGEPLWPFGYGLSYTQFKFEVQNTTHKISNLVRSNTTFSIEVTNIGKVAGDEVVQAYFTSKNDTVLRSQLWDFQRVHLAPGQTTTVKFTADYTTFQLGAKNGDLMSIPGEYEVKITNGVDIKIMASVEVSGKDVVIEQFHQ